MNNKTKKGEKGHVLIIFNNSFFSWKWSRETKSRNNDFVEETLSNVISATDFRVKIVH